MVKFNPDSDIPSLAGRVIIVTGGTDGLGKESVLQLSKHEPAHIYLAARSQAKAEAAIAEIQSKSPTAAACPITFLPLDLSDFASIKSAASTFLARESRLDILMCNAGVMGAHGTTTEGYDIVFGTNHVGHALLIKLLLPTLFSTARSQRANADVRVVILASEAETHAPKATYLLAPADIKSDMPKLNVLTRYGHSKIANVHHAAALARHHPEADTGVKFIAVHPGAVVTNLGNELLAGWPRTARLARKFFTVVLGLVPVEQGAQGQLWAATGEGVKTGAFYHPVGVEGKGSAKSRDENLAEELWRWTEEELEGHVVDPTPSA